MSQPVKKIDTLRALMRDESWPQALSLAAKFPRLGCDKAVIVRAHECTVNPSFYRQLGVDAEQAIQAGIDALKARYS